MTDGRSRAALVVASLAALSFALPAGAQQQAKSDTAPRALSLEYKPWTGDFDQMLERRVVRVLVPYSRTLYFVDKGHERGITAELLREFERYLNSRYAKQLGNRPLTLVFIPTPRDKLLSGLVEGRGDIAAGNLTVTEERLKAVDFVVAAGAKPVRELVVTGPASPPLETLDDLSGKTVHVRRSTSYYESLAALNASFAKEGKAPMQIVELPASLEDEDELEMLAAGVVQIVVVDDWLALMWARVLPKVKVRQDLVLRAEGRTGWAVRKGSPKLVETASAFYGVARKQGLVESRLASYHKRIKQISNNTSSAEWKRFQATVRLFQKYGAKYDFDPLMLAAQGFQESRLRQDARSHVGAIGVMQIMPATGEELAVGDITQLEPNIHAGAKYMDRLMTRYFADAHFTEQDRTLFAFASYNAGPGNIAKMRADATKRGLDPDKWFDNVEIVVARRIGMETTTYVRNIFKYYVAYKLAVDAQQARLGAREQIAPGKAMPKKGSPPAP